MPFAGVSPAEARAIRQAAATAGVRADWALLALVARRCLGATSSRDIARALTLSKSAGHRLDAALRAAVDAMHPDDRPRNLPQGAPYTGHPDGKSAPNTGHPPAPNTGHFPPSAPNTGHHSYYLSLSEYEREFLERRVRQELERLGLSSGVIEGGIRHVRGVLDTQGRKVKHRIPYAVKAAERWAHEEGHVTKAEAMLSAVAGDIRSRAQRSARCHACDSKLDARGVCPRNAIAAAVGQPPKCSGPR